MAYNIVDLLGKLKTLEENAFHMYSSMASAEGCPDIRLCTAAKVLAKEEERHTRFYRRLIEQAEQQPETEIDFSIYDKASSLVEGFRKMIVKPQVTSVQELIQFAVEFEKDNVALLIDIRGRMVKREEDHIDFNYLTLTELILEEQKHVDMLKGFIK